MKTAKKNISAKRDKKDTISSFLSKCNSRPRPSFTHKTVFNADAWSVGSSCDISHFHARKQDKEEEGWKIEDRNIDPIEIERKVYEADKSKFLKDYEGKYIALLNGKILDFDTDFSKLAEKVYAKAGYKEIFMTLVTRREKPHKISPKFK